LLQLHAVIHESHEGEEQRENIRAYQRTCQNSIQLEFEDCKDGYVRQEIGGAEEEAREEGDDDGIEDVASYEGRVAQV